VYTDLAIFDIDRNGVRVAECVEGLEFEALRRMVGFAALRDGRS